MKGIKIGVFLGVSLIVALLVGNKSQRAIDVENRIKFEQLQETIDKVQADPMINEFGGVDGTTVRNNLEYSHNMNPLKLQEEWAKWELKIENVNPEYLDFIINYAKNQE